MTEACAKCEALKKLLAEKELYVAELEAVVDQFQQEKLYERGYSEDGNDY